MDWVAVEKGGYSGVDWCWGEYRETFFSDLSGFSSLCLGAFVATSLALLFKATF